MGVHGLDKSDQPNQIQPIQSRKVDRMENEKTNTKKSNTKNWVSGKTPDPI
jgi:hypothetical protein